MPNHTFPCPFCGKKMGVGRELLGKKVRCPHCNQIVLAPAPTPVAVSPPTTPDQLKPQEPPVDLPVFNIPSREARESIFGDSESESDEVFGSSDGNKLPLVELPPSSPPSPPESAPVPAAKTKASETAYAPTIEMKSPFSDFGAPSSPEGAPAPKTPPAAVPKKPAPTPVIAPIGATPPSSASDVNPWAGMDSLPAASPPASPAVVPTLVPVPMPETESPFRTSEEVAKTKQKKSHDPEQEQEWPARRSKKVAAASGGNPLFKIGFFAVAAYALIVTVLAVYGLFFKSSAPPGHPLSTIPDNFGEFPPAERKKTGKANISLGGELPPEQRIVLGSGEKLPIGQLEIEPLAIEERRLNIITEGKSSKEHHSQSGTAPALVLRMKIKNTSDDLLIHPLDPAFNRKPVGNEKLGTGLLVGNKYAFWGGPIAWPFNERMNRIYEAAQEADATPLKPGETREYVVFTDSSQRIVKTVREAKETLFWRVQVRRGRIDFDGKDIPVTAIISVEFKASDVKDAES